MSDFLRFFAEKVKVFSMHLEIYYSKPCDWCIDVYKKGCANDYPGSVIDEDDVILVRVSDCDMELCFARAQVALKEWLLEHEGGY